MAQMVQPVEEVLPEAQHIPIISPLNFKALQLGQISDIVPI